VSENVSEQPSGRLAYHWSLSCPPALLINRAIEGEEVVTRWTQREDYLYAECVGDPDVLSPCLVRGDRNRTVSRHRRSDVVQVCLDARLFAAGLVPGRSTR
jgi:hypothetical protein